MNKSLDERLVPNGEYVDALNVRLGSTEESEIGAVENSKGNIPLTELQYVDGTKLSSSAKCIGAFEDGAQLVIYWFVHDPAFTQGATGKLDLIVSYDVETGELIYHVVSIDDGNGINTTLNFNPNFLITGVDKIENLLFFTDNTNPPRVININENYGDPQPGVLTDGFNKDDILVIKKPPTSAPRIETYYAPAQDDAYLEDKFICFAYRYKYENNEYSAISQFTEPAFTPGAFDFSVNSYLNEGMINKDNAVTIYFNTGASKVTDIQILFKEADSSVIKIIRSISRAQYGVNQEQQITFTKRKIFSVLPDSEILRLYDNVPQLAKAQTLMANRLVYGNYTEGYNFITNEGGNVKFDFTTTLKSEEINLSNLPVNISQGYYSIDLTSTPSTPPPVNIDDSNMMIDLSSLITSSGSKLKAGSSLTFSFGFEYSSSVVTGGGPAATPGNQNYYVNWTYTLQQDFDTVYALVNSTDFYDKVGSPTSIQTVANAANGNTLTDTFNLALPQSFDSNYTQLNQTGVSSLTPVPAAGAVGEPIIRTNYSIGSNSFGLQILAAVYYDPVSIGYLFTYNRITDATVTFQSSATSRSLHSNRGYEIGMVYMDDYNRASTAQVSELNSVNLPCNLSTSRNYIQVNIPEEQKAPYWATKYKFVIKPTATDYQTIYSNIVYRDSGTGASYFLLDGENANKVESGDKLIVKADARGPMNRCSIATVLEKEAKTAGFIDVFDAAGNEIEVFGGTYMKINASNFALGELT
jgi:hypothetical protein